MSKTWTFIGGMLAGVVSVFAAAAVATEWEGQKSDNSNTLGEEERLALPEGNMPRHDT